MPRSKATQRQHGAIGRVGNETPRNYADCLPRLTPLWRMILDFLRACDLATAWSTSRQAARTGLGVSVCRRYKLHNSVANQDRVGLESLKDLCSWSLWDGTCSIPPLLVSGFAAQALEDFQPEDWGGTSSNASLRVGARALAGRLTSQRMFTECRRILRASQGGSGDDSDRDSRSGDDELEIIQPRACWSGSTFEYEFATDLNLPDCLLRFKFGFEGCADGSGAGAVFFGSLDIAHGGVNQTLLHWVRHQDDFDNGTREPVQVDETAVARVAEALATKEHGIHLAAADVLRLLGCALCAPFRWVCNPYAYRRRSTFRAGMFRPIFKEAARAVRRGSGEAEWESAGEDSNDSDDMSCDIICDSDDGDDSDGEDNQVYQVYDAYDALLVAERSAKSLSRA